MVVIMVLQREIVQLFQKMPRPVYFVYRYINQFFGDKMVWSYSSDTSINSYVTKFDNGDWE